VRPPSSSLPPSLSRARSFHHLRKNASTGTKALVILGSLTSFVATPGCPLYATSKHALLGLQRALHTESEAAGISCVPSLLCHLGEPALTLLPLSRLAASPSSPRAPSRPTSSARSAL